MKMRERNFLLNKESAALLIYTRNRALQWNKIKAIKNKLFNFNKNQVLVLHFLDSQYQNYPKFSLLMTKILQFFIIIFFKTLLMKT